MCMVSCFVIIWPAFSTAVVQISGGFSDIVLTQSRSESILHHKITSRISYPAAHPFAAAHLKSSFKTFIDKKLLKFYN